MTDVIERGEEQQKTVFVIHGRNERLRDAMFSFLRAIGLHPLEWSEAVGMTGKGTPFIGEVLKAAFECAGAIVVLMTPDEIAYLQDEYAQGEDDPETRPAAQARPNVLFEAGMALAHNEERTVFVEIGDVRPFSDLGGRHVVRLTDDAKSRNGLVTRLKHAGCDVRTDGEDWITAGDFTPPPPPGGGLPLGRRAPAKSPNRKRIEFDLRYRNMGRNKIDQLSVINLGTEAAFDVRLSVPDDAALDLDRAEEIKKIPPGKTVTLDVLSTLRFMGTTDQAAFDVSITARTADGEEISQEVWLDLKV